MAATIVGVFQPEMHSLITESRVLLVGTGGIGCEVLKNLVLMGFTDLVIVDLDTIEVSNLNRQFLFNRESVGKAKSLVAKESVLKFNPNVNITSHFGDIMDQKYDASFFKQFKLVINALDNKKARNHVNRMCVAIDVPFIESGTMGYNGQVELIKKGMTLCYECMPKPEPKSYPMCTIRNTPKEPIHCIIWAKYLFGQLFGVAEEDMSVNETINATASSTETKVSAREWAKINDYDPKMMFKKFFIWDIDSMLALPAIREKRIITPLDNSIINNWQRVEYSHEPDTKVLTLEQHSTMFMDSVENIRQTFKDSIGSLVWDKDNDDFMNFVVSCTNIRSIIYKIKVISPFEIKSMAGNIVPAIATANAMIAGQIVIHALRILRGNFERCQSVFLREWPNHKGAVIVKDRKLQKPNPNCAVCFNNGEVLLYADCNKFTVRQFEDLVLKQRLNMVAPDLMIQDGSVIISSDESDNMDLYDKTLKDVGITDYVKLIAEDFFQEYHIKIIFQQKVQKSEEDPEFEIVGNVNKSKNDNNVIPDKSVNFPDVSFEEDDCVIIKFNAAMDDDEVYDNNDTNLSIVAATSDNIQEIESGDSKMEMTNDEENVLSKRKAEGDENSSEPKRSRSSK